MNMPKTVSQENKTYANLIACAQEIDDRRMQAKIDYVLPDIVVVAVCAILAGANNFVEIMQYGKERKRWLSEYFAINGSIPSHDTFNRVFSLINPKKFTSCMMQWLSGIFPKSKQINIDAKIIRGYRSDDPFSILRAWASETRNLLGQIRVPYGTNEITAIPMLLDQIDIEGKIVSIDAIGAQKTIVKKIIEKKGDYFIALKANQHAFYNDIKLYLDSIVNGELKDIVHTYYETADYGHGRIEKRCCWSTEDINWLEQKTQWKQLKSLSVIETIGARDGKQTINRRYFISSLEGCALLLLEVARAHWSIENQLHWQLDVTFDEDKSTIRGTFAAQNLSLLRAIAVALLGLLPFDKSFKRKRQMLNRRPSMLKKILLL